MKVIVPLAGPDFIKGNYTTKADYEITEGYPLLKFTLDQRSWFQNGYVTDHDLVFILYDTPITRSFVSSRLKVWYPNATVTFIGAYTKGAALSALAGLTSVHDLISEPICIDLADISYKDNLNVKEKILDKPNIGALALVFKSNKPFYSYLKLDKESWVCEAREKEVISNTASAGTYFFRSGLTYFSALSHCLENANLYEYNGFQFVCPLLNGVIYNKKKVAIAKVNNVKDFDKGLPQEKDIIQ